MLARPSPACFSRLQLSGGPQGPTSTPLAGCGGLDVPVQPDEPQHGCPRGWNVSFTSLKLLPQGLQCCARPDRGAAPADVCAQVQLPVPAELWEWAPWARTGVPREVRGAAVQAAR